MSYFKSGPFHHLTREPGWKGVADRPARLGLSAQDPAASRWPLAPAAATGDLATRLRVSKESAFRRNGLTGDRTSNALTV